MRIKRLAVLTLLFSIFLVIGGCEFLRRPREPVERPGDQALDRLEEAFRRGRAGDVVGLVYSDGELDLSELRSDQREVFRTRTGIRLDIHSRTFQRPVNDREAHVDTSWNLTWRDETGAVIRRRGKTEFSFLCVDDRWLITSQAGDRLLGTLNPGEKL